MNKAKLAEKIKDGFKLDLSKTKAGPIRLQAPAMPAKQPQLTRVEILSPQSRAKIPSASFAFSADKDEVRVPR